MFLVFVPMLDRRIHTNIHTLPLYIKCCLALAYNIVERNSSLYWTILENSSLRCGRIHPLPLMSRYPCLNNGYISINKEWIFPKRLYKSLNLFNTVWFVLAVSRILAILLVLHIICTLSSWFTLQWGATGYGRKTSYKCLSFIWTVNNGIYIWGRNKRVQILLWVEIRKWIELAWAVNRLEGLEDRLLSRKLDITADVAATV